jgi:hypothetical protein
MASRTISATGSIPFIYRLIITTIEPLMSINGALMALYTPQKYLATMTRDKAIFAPDTTFLYTELAGAWLYLTFVEAVVMRMFDDLRLWRVLCAGMLLSDVAYHHSAAQAVGSWSLYIDVAQWATMDWAVFLSNVITILPRILIVLGVGIKTSLGKGYAAR